MRMGLALRHWPSRTLAVAAAAALAERLVAAAGSSANQEVLLWDASRQDSPCSDVDNVPQATCLGKNGGKCMWMELDTKNLCLPCDWDGIDIPCAPVGAVYPAGKVKNCYMACSHQTVITKISMCTDVSGDITQSDCQAKGTSGEAKCMWTAYKMRGGDRRTMCGPCLVEGTGEVPRYLPGGAGPEPGSRVVASYSQCEEAAAVTPCPPTPPPTLPGGLPAPVKLSDLGLSAAPGAPDYVAVPVEAPYGLAAYRRAAAAAARVAGWPKGSALPPSTAVALYAPPPKEGPTLPPGMQVVYVRPPPGLRGLMIAPSMPSPVLVPQAAAHGATGLLETAKLPKARRALLRSRRRAKVAQR